MALEKARLWHYCVKELHRSNVSPQLLQQLANVGCHDKHCLDGDSKMKLAAWVEVAETDSLEKSLRKGKSQEYRQKILDRLQEALGFDLAKGMLRVSAAPLSQSQHDQRDAIAAKAKLFCDDHVHFEVYGKADLLEDALNRLPPEWMKECSVLNKSHRLFVVSTSLLFENEKMPWNSSSKSGWTKSQSKEFASLLKTVKTAASQDGETCLCVSHGFSTFNAHGSARVRVSVTS